MNSFFTGWRVLSIGAIFLLMGANAFAFSLEGNGENTKVQNIVYLADTNGIYDWEKIKASEGNLPLMALAADGNLHGKTDVYWLHFDLENPKSVPEEVALTFERWDRVTMYSTSNGQDYPPQRTGLLIPYGLRDYRYNAAIMTRVKLKPGEVRSIWICLENDDDYGPPFGKLRVWAGSRKEAEEMLISQASINLVILAMLFFILLYNLFFYFALREIRYRFYLLHLLFIVLELFRWAGFWGPILGSWEGLPMFECSLFYWQNLFYLTWHIFLIRDFLNPREFAPNLDKVLLWLPIPVALSACLFYFQFDTALILGLILGGGGMVMTIWMSWIAYRRKHPLAGYFLVSVLIYGVVGNWQILNLGSFLYAIPSSLLPMRSIASLITDSILGYALGRQFYGFSQDNAQKQRQIIQNLQIRARLRSGLNREILFYQELARKDVATRLQDDVQVNLIEIRKGLDKLEPDPDGFTESASQLMAESIRRIENIAHDLMPESLENPEGLQQAVAVLLDRVSKAIEVRFDYVDSKPLPEEIRILAYRSINEIMTNTLKHSQASRLELAIVHDPENVSIVIQDNGIGFDPNEDKAGKGLQNIRHSLTIFGGGMQVESAPNSGTRISINLPLENQGEAMLVAEMSSPANW